MKAAYLPLTMIFVTTGCFGPVKDGENETSLIGSVTDFEQDEVIVFEPVLDFGAENSSAIRGEADPLLSDVHGGVLASAVHFCADGRPVWLRSANDVPTVIVTPSKANLLSSAPKDSVADADETVIRCVRERYAGAFKAGIATSGLFPWAMTKVATAQAQTKKDN